MEQLSTPLLIYLFADVFVQPPAGVLAQAALAPRTGEKVDLKLLVLRIYAAAFMDLVYSGQVRLSTGQVKKFLGKETGLVAGLSQNSAARDIFFGSLLIERLLAGFSGPETRVRDLVIRQIGGRRSTKSPWLDALSPLISEAMRCGYIIPPEKRPGVFTRLVNPAETRTRVIPVLTRIDPLRSYAIDANGRLDQFLVFQGDNGELLLKEIESGISACQDRADFD